MILVLVIRVEELLIVLQVVDRVGIVVKEIDDWYNWIFIFFELLLGFYIINVFLKGVDVGIVGFDEFYYWG